MYTQHVSRTREVHKLKQRCYPFGRNIFCRKLLIDTQKIDFLKILIACSIAGLSYNENSNGHKIFLHNKTHCQKYKKHFIFNYFQSGDKIKIYARDECRTHPKSL